ncbi:MAG TPA: tRNA (adenosine(37)-N6)-threonylcarbamoyltransferase complex transferase subunit TsaD [Candidatus Azoamicus sp. OHIO2]
MINDLLILGIETSCDDTSISIFNNRTGILNEYIFTQKIHAKYGGTVPELASRDHLNKIFNIILFILKKKKINISNISLIAYTKGPGLHGPLFIGSSVAKSLGLFLKIPTIGVNHLEAHILMIFLFNSNLKVPCLALLISGAHTILLKILQYQEIMFIGETLDDSIGETFDKIARLFNFYPANGISIENSISYKFKYIKLNLVKSLRQSKDFNFSFSGLKSEIKRNKNQVNDMNLLYNFQATVINIFITKCKKLLYYDEKITGIILAGGVSANKELRLAFKNLAEEFSIYLHILPKKYCTDNASMIAFLGFIKLYDGNFDENLNITVFSHLKIKYIT